MAEIATAEGAEIRLESPLEQILSAGRRTTGVRLVSGETIKADAVIMNADYGTAVTQLLNGKGVPDSRLRRNLINENLLMQDKQNKDQEVVAALRQVVADTYALIGQTHLCHWNVRGSGFFALHQAFEQQYTELFLAVDEVAERVRALGALAPGGLGNLASMAGMTELNEDASADEMVKHLAAMNRQAVKDLGMARDLAAEGNDKESEDLMIARIQVHQKTIWMLESFLQ